MKLISSLVILVILSFGFAACMKEDPNAAMEKRNKETTMKVYETFNKHDLSGLDQFFAADFVEHQPDPSVKTKGVAGLKESFTNMYTGFPDLKFTPNHIIADCTMVTIQYTMSGTYTKTIPGMEMMQPAHGQKINVDGVDIARMDKDGKCAEHWGYWDNMAWMQQIGMAGMETQTTSMPGPGKDTLK